MAGSATLGLRANWRQFALLVLINAFVGGMVGIERTVVPLIGSEEFGIASTTLIVSFIVSFGVVKALANLVSGQLADRWGRKRVLVLGWLVGLPVPFMLLWAPNWGWVIAANALLGVSQGLAWSMTVIMKIDLVGPKGRGLAVGLNEFAGYFAVGVTAFLTGYLASRYGLRPVPIWLGIGYAVLGTAFSILVVRDTREHVRLEMAGAPATDGALSFREVFTLTSYRDRNLFAASQAGLVNNLNDGMSWGIFPLYFAAFGLGVERIGILKAVYPAAWGLLQVATGPLSDRWGRKGLIVAGMWVQAGALALTAASGDFRGWLAASVLLGLGTAMVYPSLIAAVSDASHPAWRARSLSVYRFWRDLGYAIGALSAGIIADLFGLRWAIGSIAALTFASGLVVVVAMRERVVVATAAAPPGPMGAAAFTGAIPDSLDDGERGPGFPIEVFNVLGAGDGFMSGLLTGWLTDQDWPTALKYANACGAFAVSRHGCAPAYPSWDELQFFLKRGIKVKALRKDLELEQLHWSTNRLGDWPEMRVFAFDHRMQLEAVADELKVDRDRIGPFKDLCLRAAQQIAAARHDLVKGFAVGRTIFAEAARAWLGGAITDAEAVDEMAGKYQRLCRIWDEARAQKGAAA